MELSATRPREAFTRAEDLSNGRRALALAFLATAYLLYSWAWNTVDVLRPYIAGDLHLSLPQAGSLYSAQAAGALIGAVVNGQVADRFGRRNALMAVMVGYGVMLMLGAAVTNYVEVLAQRFIMAYFMGSMYPITVGIYSGLFSQKVRGRVAAVIMGSSYLSSSLLGIAAAAVFKMGLNWKILLWIGIVPVVLAGFAVLIIPNDRTLIPYGGATAPDGGATPKGRMPVTELFSRNLRKQTLMLTGVVGLNFFGYQAFSGWATTYLKEVRHFADADIGATVGWMFAGSVLGGFFWGWIGDRFGRRLSATGFFITAALILVYLFVPMSLPALEVVAGLYGVALSCSVVWGPWLAELYPSHLRSTAASIFQWGRIISFFAPLITGALAEHVGLGVTMAIASAAFVIAAIMWLRLPETVIRAQAA